MGSCPNDLRIPTQKIAEGDSACLSSVCIAWIVSVSGNEGLLSKGGLTFAQWRSVVFSSTPFGGLMTTLSHLGELFNCLIRMQYKLV